MNLDHIVHCEARDNYTVFHLDNGETVMTLKNLGHFEDLLPKDRFFRIHKRHIVNMDHVFRVHRMEGAYCQLSNKKNLSISRRRHKMFLKKLQYLP